MSAAVLGTAAPRQVFCVIDHTYRDLSVAEAVSRGRFTHAGFTLDLGLEPDWQHAELPSDPEWGIEWRKFYYGLDLAHAFQQTVDPKFQRAWESLVGSFIRQVPSDADRIDVTARRVLNWIYAWQRFGSSSTVDNLEASLANQVAHVRGNLTSERNHRTFELYALFVAALALPDLDADDRLLAFAVHELHANLLQDVRPDGVHREASTHYHHVALRTYLGMRENAGRFDVQLPDGFDERLERACEFAMHCHRPDGSIPALSDADSGSYLDLLALAAELYSRDDFLNVATAGLRGSPPTSRNVSFPSGGYFVQRSGWGRGTTAFGDERYLIFDCGPLGDGGHGHYDALSVEIAAGGRPLIVDPGRFTYAESEGGGWRRWFKGTAAHNTVCVDGLDQTPYRRGAPRGSVARARLLERHTATGLDVVRGEVRSPSYTVVHQRRVVFVGDEYWLIEDLLEADGPHHYDLRFHLTPAAAGHTSLTIDDQHTLVRAPGLALATVPAGEPRLEPGWVAPLYGHKLPAPTLSITQDSTCASFVTLVLPLAAGRPAPRLRVRHAHGITTVEVARVGPRGDARDLVAWGSARTSWVRFSAHGTPERFEICA